MHWFVEKIAFFILPRSPYKIRKLYLTEIKIFWKIPSNMLGLLSLEMVQINWSVLQLSTELLNRILLRHERDGELGKYPSTPPGSGLVNPDFTVNLIQFHLNLYGLKYNLNWPSIDRLAYPIYIVTLTIA